MVQRLTRYRPSQLDVTPQEWAELSGLLLTVTAAAGPTSPKDASRIMSILTRAAVFNLRAGLGSDPETWLLEESINRFVLNWPGLKPGSIRTYRSTLRRVRDALVWMNREQGQPVRFSSSQAPQTPYSERELPRLRAWSQGLRTAYQRRCAKALLTLGAGCGLTSGEIGRVRGHDVQVLDSGAVVVNPPGSERVVACRASWEDELAALAGVTHGEQYFFAQQRTTAEPVNLIGNITGTLPHSVGVPRLDTRRLRSTWLVDLMRSHVPHEVIAKAAGLSSTGQLARYSHWVPEIEQPAALRMLRGTAWQ